MNPHSIPPKTTPPFTNGHHETPLEASGVSLHRPPPQRETTTFPVDLPLRGLGPWLYGFQRFQLGGLPVARYIAAPWLAVALLAALGIVPGRWITLGIALLLWLGQLALMLRYQRQRYVTFAAAPLPALNDVPLDTTEKVAIYATGLLSVEGRYQQYTVLPGFYRTFATGEHALLCLVQNRKWLGMLSWPPEETGMWYAFIHPSDIERLTWGNLRFGDHDYPALAIEYRLEIPPGPRRKRTEIRQETLYLSSPNLQDLQRVFVDLLTNLPQDRIVTPQSAT
ncbi:MAG: hypothetical protein IT328_07570 [Caldilineaceae bacterium]|nr:hypothetical protein [Caldilineaceae bacterium]